MPAIFLLALFGGIGLAITAPFWLPPLYLKVKLGELRDWLAQQDSVFDPPEAREPFNFTEVNHATSDTAMKQTIEDWKKLRPEDIPDPLLDNVADPHCSGPVRCLHCGAKWVAVWPAFTSPEKLECAACWEKGVEVITPEEWEKSP